jgi:hypothetical protein
MQAFPYEPHASCESEEKCTEAKKFETKKDQNPNSRIETFFPEAQQIMKREIYGNG